ncbi:related to DNA ligase I [Melanopsichium pennsylvanicum]|uniref:Related to DNA ligase I n=2 Tax=Melanopsichium pennsylvanicum TaxID=63383 RepID=A0AAJ4XQK2_9BASI|nr:related to DNA ligase I [Melanopsichium pennsylvanicum 4]SNX86960.1 related to DNA ligase I [Melanopsichium pennsylvanicum]
MPPRKRTNGNSQPSTPTKKTKTRNQSSLTSFFASPSSKSTATVVDEPTTPTTNAAKANQKQLVIDLVEEEDADVEATVSKQVKLQEEGDAAIAAQLAAQEAGLSVEMYRTRMQDDEDLARRLHLEWSGEQDQSARKTDDNNQAGPSEYPPRTVSPPDPPSTPSKKPLPISALDSTSKKTPPTPKIVDLAALDASIQAIKLGEDIFVFDPWSIDTSSWPAIVNKDGNLVSTTPYALLTHAFVLISATRSRLAITTLLTNLLRIVRAHDPESLLPTVYLVSNHIAPPYDGVELGLGGSIINKAIKSVTGKSARFMKQVWDRTGDPGDVAYEAKKDVKALVRPAPITVQRLFSNLHSIAKLSGTGSANQKLGYVTKLLVASRGEETRFLVRTFISHLRIQAVRTTIATALARTFALIEESSTSIEPSHPREKERAAQLLIYPYERKGILANAIKPKERQDPNRLALMERLARAEKLVREVRARHPNFGVIVHSLLQYGLAGLSEHVPLRIGTPISPMLGSITRSLGAMHDKLGPRAFVSEFKYDGQRCQIHAVYVPRSAGPEARRSVREETSSKAGKWVGKDGEIYVRLFSRHLEEMTEKYPDITDMVPILMGQETEDDANIGGNAFVDSNASSFKAQSKTFECEANVTKQEEEVGLVTESRRQPITSFIMDAEVVAMDLDGRLLPFQTLANRSRKDVNLHDIKVKVGVFAFDLMYLDGESLLKSSFRTRRNLLHGRFLPLSPQSPLIAKFAHVRSCESTDPDDVARFFTQAQEYKCEGIMVKSLDHHWEAPTQSKDFESDQEDQGEEGEEAGRLTKLADVVDDDLAMDNEDEAVKTLDDNKRHGSSSTASGVVWAENVGKGVNGRGKALLSTYEPDKRCESWLKVKKDYVEGLGDSLDLVPIGAWHGMGRKATWWSPMLLALYDPTTGVLQAVCKCISGFTDAFYKDLNVRYAEGSDTCVRARWGEANPFGIEVETGNLWPDVWWKPQEVWEIRGADVTISPNYTAAIGLVTEEKGLSIRFPRFIKGREDKTIEQASTPASLAKIYFEQQKAAPAPGGEAKGQGDEDEVASEDEAEDDDQVKASVDDDFEL